MKKKILILMGLICAMAFVLTGCGLKTEQAQKKLEVNESYSLKKLVTCNDEDAKIKLKDGGHSYTADQLGDVDLTFVITKDNKEEEETFTFKVVDSKGPTVNSGKMKEIYEGDAIDISKLYVVSDNYSDDENITTKADTSKINADKAGDYEFTVTATDEAGNKTEKTLTFTVKEQPPTFGDTIETSSAIFKLKKMTHSGHVDFYSYKPVIGDWTKNNGSVWSPGDGYDEYLNIYFSIDNIGTEEINTGDFSPKVVFDDTYTFTENKSTYECTVMNQEGHEVVKSLTKKSYIINVPVPEKVIKEKEKSLMLKINIPGNGETVFKLR